jgi:hypothetical protein
MRPVFPGAGPVPGNIQIVVAVWKVVGLSLGARPDFYAGILVDECLIVFFLAKGFYMLAEESKPSHFPLLLLPYLRGVAPGGRFPDFMQ